VTVATRLLLLVAVAQVAGLVLALSYAGTVRDVYTKAYKGTDAEGAIKLVTTLGTVVSIVLGLLFGAAFVVLAILNGKGKNPARITTWVVGGIALCCIGFGLATSAAGNSFTMRGGGTNSNLPDPAEVRRQLDAALPSWYNGLSVTVSLIGLLALLAALILLALPPSNEFFRKPQPQWQAPPGYPPPGYPPPAGYAQPGSPPPPPPSPGSPVTGYPQPGVPPTGHPQSGGPPPSYPPPDTPPTDNPPAAG
jgi:hypothetical protein